MLVLAFPLGFALGLTLVLVFVALASALAGGGGGSGYGLCVCFRHMLLALAIALVGGVVVSDPHDILRRTSWLDTFCVARRSLKEISRVIFCFRS